MFKFIGVIISFLIGASAYAENTTEFRERILSDKTTRVTIELTGSTVRCSSLGYGVEELKVSVPDLAWLAVLDHSNPGEAQPCITAGACRTGNKPEDLVSDQKFETTDIRVVLNEVLRLDHAHKACLRWLREDVSADIRGKPFRHVREASLGAYPYDICTQL